MREIALMKIATIGLRHTWTPGTLGTLGTIGSLAKIGYLIFIGTETDFLNHSWNVLDFDTKTKRCSWCWQTFYIFCQSSKLCRINSKCPFQKKSYFGQGSDCAKRLRGPSVVWIQVCLSPNEQ